MALVPYLDRLGHSSSRSALKYILCFSSSVLVVVVGLFFGFFCFLFFFLVGGNDNVLPVPGEESKSQPELGL